MVGFIISNYLTGGYRALGHKDIVVGEEQRTFKLAHCIKQDLRDILVATVQQEVKDRVMVSIASEMMICWGVD